MIPLYRRTFMKLLGSVAALGSGVARAAPIGSRSDFSDTGDRAPFLSEKIARFITEAKYEDLPPNVVRKTKEQIVFLFGRALEGLQDRKADHIRTVANLLAQPRNGATVIGEDFKLFPSDAAFANCSLMRGSTRDDVIWSAGIHAGVVTIPTALAVAEVSKVSGKDLILSIALGYEVLGKLGGAKDGWAAALPRRPTIIFGGFGPTTVAAKLRRLDAEKTANALAYAANIGIGVPEKGMMQHYYSFINRNGLFAVDIVQAGGGPYAPSVIEGEFGLYRSFYGEMPREAYERIERLGTDWDILTTERKIFPGTGQNAIVFQRLLELLTEHNLSANDVKAIRVTYTSINDAPARKREVSNRGPFEKPVEAYSSLPYGMALALLEREIPYQRYADDLSMMIYNDPKVATEMRKMRVEFAAMPGKSDRFSVLELETVDGRNFRRESDSLSIDFGPEEWGGWIRKYGTNVLSASKLDRLEAGLVELERVENIADLMAAAS